MRVCLVALSSLVLALPATAQIAGWSGEGSFSASTSSGNTETTQLGLGVDMDYERGRWTFGFTGSADYGETDGVETQNKYLVSGTADAQIRDRLFGFGQAQYEANEFSGYEHRIFVGGGLGYDIFDADGLSWSVRGGPGFKIDEMRPTVTDGVVTEPGETAESISFLASSDFSYAFNDNVDMTNTSSAIYSEETTQLVNTIAVTAVLTDALSARMSFDVRHDTNPQEGFEATDTTTKVSLVYRFGG